MLSFCRLSKTFWGFPYKTNVCFSLLVVSEIDFKKQRHLDPPAASHRRSILPLGFRSSVHGAWFFSSGVCLVMLPPPPRILNYQNLGVVSYESHQPNSGRGSGSEPLKEFLVWSPIAFRFTCFCCRTISSYFLISVYELFKICTWQKHTNIYKMGPALSYQWGYGAPLNGLK